LLTVSISFMNVANSVLWRMAIILKVNKVNLFVSCVLFVFWYISPKFLDTPYIVPHTNHVQCLLHADHWANARIMTVAYSCSISSCYMLDCHCVIWICINNMKTFFKTLIFQIYAMI
jgi:hypothetical protein